MDAVTCSARTLAVLHESARLLAFARQGRLPLDDQGAPLPAALDALCAVLRARPSASLYPRFLIHLLRSAGLLPPALHRGAGGEKIGLEETEPPQTPPRALDSWLSLPPALQLQHLREVWWWQVAWTPPPLLELGALPNGRYAALVEEICRWLSTLPENSWSQERDLLKHLKAGELLYPPGVASNLPRVRRIFEEQIMMLAHLLSVDLLPALGLLETRSVADHVELRPAPQGARWLQAALEARRRWQAAGASAQEAQERRVPAGLPDFPPPASPALHVTERANCLDVKLEPCAAPLCSFILMHIAELYAVGGPLEPSRYRLTPDSLARGLTWGYPPSEVIFLLAHWSEGELPVSRLRSWQEEMTRVRCTPGYLLEAHPGVIPALREQRTARRYTQTLTHGRALWVAASDSAALFKHLRRHGYALTPPEAPPGLSPAARATLPLLPLWVLLRTHTELQALFLALSDLGLVGLAEEIEGALSPQERLAAEHLLASQLSILGFTSASTESLHQEASPELLNHLRDAIDEEHMLTLTYVDARANLTERRVLPLRLEECQGAHYLVAHCELRDAERTFRLDRIVEVH